MHGPVTERFGCECGHASADQGAPTDAAGVGGGRGVQAGDGGRLPDPLLPPSALGGDTGTAEVSGVRVKAVSTRPVSAGIGVVRLLGVCTRASVHVVDGSGRAVAAGVRIGIDVAKAAAASKIVVSAAGGVDRAGVGVDGDLTFQARSGRGIVIGLEGAAAATERAGGEKVADGCWVRATGEHVVVVHPLYVAAHVSAARVRVANTERATPGAGVGVVVPVALGGGAGHRVVAVAGHLAVAGELR